MIPLNFFKTSKSKAVQIYKKKEKKFGLCRAGTATSRKKAIVKN